MSSLKLLETLKCSTIENCRAATYEAICVAILTCSHYIRILAEL